MIFKRIIGTGLAALALAACTKTGSGESGGTSGEVERVPVNFSLSLGGKASGTKADVSKLLELAETPKWKCWWWSRFKMHSIWKQCLCNFWKK